MTLTTQPCWIYNLKEMWGK